MGGVSANGRTLAKAELWDSYGKRVNALPSKLSAARQKHKATLLADGNVLIEGGNDAYGNKVTSNELYNSEANSFSLMKLNRLKQREVFSFDDFKVMNLMPDYVEAHC